MRLECRLENLILANGFIHGVTYSHLGQTVDMETDAVILAIGHSARDTVEMLYKNGAQIIQKPFSVGARIEHPQKLIDKAQYGAFAGHPKLGAADYKLSCHGLHQRGAYTFCMCPGGTVVAAASEKGGVIVNGMSTLARDGENANSALLVGIDPVDFPSEHPLAGMYYQREIEQNAFALGGGRLPCTGAAGGRFLSGSEKSGAGQCAAHLPDRGHAYQPAVLPAGQGAHHHAGGHYGDGQAAPRLCPAGRGAYCAGNPLLQQRADFAGRILPVQSARGVPLR